MKRVKHFYNEGLRDIKQAIALFVGCGILAYLLFDSTGIGDPYASSSSNPVGFIFFAAVMGSVYGLGSIINYLVRKWVRRRARADAQDAPPETSNSR